MQQYTRTDRKGKISVKQDEPFVDALAGRDPRKVADYGKLLEDAEGLVLKEFKAAPNAFRKLRGDWYEGAIALAAYSFAAEKNTKYCLVNLPKISSFKVHKLYTPQIAELIDELTGAVQNAADVSLISSNPDFAIVRRDLVPTDKTIGFDLTSLRKVNALYQQYAGKCELDDVAGYTSVKTSLKPDRRLQMAHEGSLMKALYRHIQTRQWLIGARGIKFYGMTMRFGKADEKALKTVATHSIVDVLGTPESAVDKLYAVPGGAELDDLLEEILN